MIYKKWVSEIYSKKDDFWIKLGKSEFDILYKRVTKEVPAYKNFLKNKSKSNFKTNKKNFFNKYRLQDFFSGKKQKLSGVFTSTSGSTGAPVYFSRNNILEKKYSAILEHFLNLRPISNTLVVNCFGMGVWIGGLITYGAFEILIDKGMPISVISPGISKKDIFTALNKLAKEYDQIILCGYPPFIKDIVSDEEFPKFSRKQIVRIVFAAESFTENFRKHISSLAGVKDPLIDTMNIYGSAELGAMAFETPTSILVRHLIYQNPRAKDLLFNGRLPTVAQFDPRMTNIKENDGRILVGGDSAMPVLNYDIGDNGKVFYFEELVNICKSEGLDLVSELKSHGIKPLLLPFVFVFERSDFSISFYGLQIYPQHVKICLEALVNTKQITGRFTIEQKLNNKFNQLISLNVELAKGVKPDPRIKKLIVHTFLENLPRINSEFRELGKHVSKSRLKPRVRLWKYGSVKYFKAGIKQKWIKK